MGLLRELYKKSKSNEYKTIYITIGGQRKELSTLDLTKANLSEISEIMDKTLKAYLEKIDSLKELSQLSVSLKELSKKYFESGGPLSNEYFQAHNKILKDIEERIAKRVGTTATVKSVDATNVSVHNQ